jgi:anti-sigma factor RsiW
MMNCKDIENSLPLYLDNLLSPADMRAVEEHLATCAQCKKELAHLQKAGKLVDELAELEPPPWFKQRIMARVREEAEKKSFAQKWFYSLRIKIPVQVFATIFIVVLAGTIVLPRPIFNDVSFGGVFFCENSDMVLLPLSGNKQRIFKFLYNTIITY